MSYTPPSIYQQRWGRLALLLIIILILSQGLQIAIFWPDHLWGQFSQHVAIIAKGAWYFLSQGSLMKITYYITYLKGHGIYSSMINNIFLSFFASLSLAVLITYKFVWVPGGSRNLIKINGPSLYKENTFKIGLRRLQKQRRKQSSKSKIAIHPHLQLTNKELEGNTFVFGQQGSGKSVIIKPLLKGIIDNNEIVVIYDEKREYTELFYDVKDTILIAPWDKRSAYWHISKDLQSTEDFELMAQRLINDRPSDPMWSNGAKVIFAGILAICKSQNKEEWGWSDIADTLSTEDFILRELLDMNYKGAVRYIEPNSKTTHGFMSTLMTDVSWINSIAGNWKKTTKSAFSIKEWLGGKNPQIKKIIIQSHPQFKFAGAPLCNAMLGFLTSLMLSKPDGHSRNTRLVLDELGNLPKNDSLKEWLSLGRSKGCRLIAGTQSISQLHEKYGEQDTDTILNLFSTVIALRCGVSGDVAEYAAKCFGESIYERPSIDLSKSSSANNWQKETWQLVTTDDLKHLPQASKNGVTGYITSSGWNSVFKLQWPYPDLAIQSESHIPAPWLTARNTKPSKTKNGRLRNR
jgi:hypothetical protein